MKPSGHCALLAGHAALLQNCTSYVSGLGSTLITHRDNLNTELSICARELRTLESLAVNFAGDRLREPHR